MVPSTAHSLATDFLSVVPVCADHEPVRTLIQEYQLNRIPIRWPIAPEATSAIDVFYRNGFIQRLARESVPRILESYVYFTVAEMKEMVALALRHLHGEPLRGVGLDLGSGSALLASVVAREKSVEAVLAIEICEQAATLLMPKVASWVMGKDAHKVIPVVGSFNDLRLPNESIDFAVEIDSFHHSNDLALTFRECARVLKPGGTLLCFDRVWPNEHPDDDLKRLLEVIYPPAYLVAHGYPADLVLSRKANGEHEYKLAQWQQAFRTAGFDLVKLCKFMQKTSHRRALKGVLSILPEKVRRVFYQTDNATLETSRQWLSQQLIATRRLLNGRNNVAAPDNWPQQDLFAPRETSVFFLRKSIS